MALANSVSRSSVLNSSMLGGIARKVQSSNASGNFMITADCAVFPATGKKYTEPSETPITSGSSHAIVFMPRASGWGLHLPPPNA